MRKELNGIIGERLFGTAKAEACHFYLCPACGQAVDKRDLAAVFHHEEAGHAPLPPELAVRITLSTRMLHRALRRGSERQRNPTR